MTKAGKESFFIPSQKDTKDLGPWRKEREREKRRKREKKERDREREKERDSERERIWLLSHPLLNSTVLGSSILISSEGDFVDQGIKKGDDDDGVARSIMHRTRI